MKRHHKSVIITGCKGVRALVLKKKPDISFRRIYHFTVSRFPIAYPPMSTYIPKFRRSILVLTGVAALAFAGLTTPAQGTDLGEALAHVNWKGIVGSWVDSETKGERVKIVYAWKFENKLIEVNSTMGDTKGISLMGYNPDSEEVFMMGGNSEGGGNLGKWSMDDEDAVLELSYVRADGEKGEMSLKHHWVNDDTIEVSGTAEEGGESFTLTLVRSK